MKINPQDDRRIAEAVARAEAGTSGEIRCVLAMDSSESRRDAIVWASGAALLVPAAALLLGLEPHALSRVFGGWTIGHLAAADAQIISALGTYILMQAAVFALTWALASWPWLRRTLTPPRMLSRRVHEAALQQFGIQGLHRTRDRTGVLLYASLAEHRAEVLADEGVYDKVPHEVWDEVVQLLIAGLKRGQAAEGFVAAVERTGDILAGGLPPRGDDANELPDGLIQKR